MRRSGALSRLFLKRIDLLRCLKMKSLAAIIHRKQPWTISLAVIRRHYLRASIAHKWGCLTICQIGRKRGDNYQANPLWIRSAFQHHLSAMNILRPPAFRSPRICQSCHHVLPMFHTRMLLDSLSLFYQPVTNGLTTFRFFFCPCERGPCSRDALSLA